MSKIVWPSRKLTDTERVIAWFRNDRKNTAQKKKRYRHLQAAGSCRCGAEKMKNRTRCLECARKNSACVKKRTAKKRGTP